MKRKLTTILAVMVLGSSVIGFAAPKKTLRTKKGTKTVKVTGATKKTEISKKAENYTCENEIIKVEYDGDTAKLTNKNGTHILKRSKSASGELYSNEKGMSIHTNGKDTIYTESAKAPDFVCVKRAVASVSHKKVENFKIEGKNLKLEHITDDVVKVTDLQGNVHELKREESASGEKFSNKEGVSLHFKGNSGIFTIGGVDYSLTR